MDDIIEEIKRRTQIEDLVEEMGFPLQRRHGRYLKGRQHDSLTIDTHNQSYHWNSQDEHGDIFNWVMNRNKGWDFRAAMEFLARRINLAIPEHGEQNLKARLATRAREDAFEVAARVFAKWLKEDQDAWAYVQSRGWSEETIEKAQIGFSGRGSATEYQEIGAEFALHGVDPASPAAVAITGFKGDVGKWLADHGLEDNEDWVKWKMIPGMMGRKRLVYPHFAMGRLKTLAGRNILGDEKTREGEEVKSWNIPVALGGARQCFYNWEYGPKAEELVIVEGQADAITLGEWGIPAMATAGTAWKDHEALLKELRERHHVIYMATDADEGGRKVITGKDGDFPLADVLGPMLRVVTWTEKDANDTLKAMIAQGVDHEKQIELVKKTLEVSEPIVMTMARTAGQLKGAKRDKAVERAIKTIARMDNTKRAMYRLQLTDALGITVREFNNLISTERKEAAAEGEDGGPAVFTETLGGWFPIEGGMVNGVQKGWLIEYLYDRTADKAMLAYRDPEGRVGTAPHIDINGIRYVPVKDDDIIRQGGVVFASELGKLESTRELVLKIEIFLKRYFLLDNPFDYRLAAYYVMLTWVYDCFSAIPYLRAQGDTNTGKSELMLRIGGVCYRMVVSTGASSTAALKFALDVYRGTMFMDEMDIADKFDDRIVILNVGAMRDQAKVWNMVEVKNEQGARSFRGVMANVYGPKLITMYGKFKDPATEGRCLTFKLVEKEPWELARRGIPIEKGEEFYRESQHIRNLLMRWRLWRWEPRIELDKNLADMRVSTRINQVTMPIKQLARAKKNDPNDQDDAELIKDIEGFIQNLNDELVLERSMGLQARVMDAVVASLTEAEYASYVVEAEVEGHGHCKYIFYKHLSDIANKIMDEMNRGESRPDEGEDEGKKKSKFKELTSPTVGSICRRDLRLPVKRMGKGFVVILDTERIEALMVKFGLTKQSADGKHESLGSITTKDTKVTKENQKAEPSQEKML